jgi:GTPase Era involved in 16S rRNA processing
MAQLRKNARNLRNAHRNLGAIFGNNFYQQNMIHLKMMERRAKEIMREKKMLERTRQELIRYQLSRGFPRAG